VSAGSVKGLPRPPVLARRRAWHEARYAALDFETTGLDLRTDTVVSFGVVPVDGARVVMRGAMHQLIEPHIPPSPRSQTIHELRPQDLAGSPTIDEARASLRTALQGRILLVWFAEVELNFLKVIFGGAARGWRRRTIDVRSVAMAVDGIPPSQRDQRGYPLSGTARRYGIPVEDPHEALDDAVVTAQLFLVLASKVPGKPRPRVRDLLELGKA
jgi:DNA polymerase-3 subunit epsilon